MKCPKFDDLPKDSKFRFSRKYLPKDLYKDVYEEDVLTDIYETYVSLLANRQE